MIHVRLCNRLLDNKKSCVVFLPLIIWVFTMLGTLFTMFATSYYILVVVLGVGFLCFIPVFLWCRKRTRRAFQELSEKIYEADLEVRNRKLYYGKLELQIQYSKRWNVISLKHEIIAGKYMTKALSFWSTVYEEDVETFLKLAYFYHLKIKGLRRQ